MIAQIWQNDTLFLGLDTTDLYFPLKEAFALWYKLPEIERRISDDIELHAALGKEARLKEKQFKRNPHALLSIGQKPSVFGDCTINDVDLFTLNSGRPRSVTAGGLFLFFILRGYLGSFEQKRIYARMKDSSFLKELLPRLGMNRDFPSVQCLNDYLAILSDETVNYIFEQQLEASKKDGLISLDYLLSDSTFIEANSEWPTESSLLHRLTAKAFNYSHRLSLLLGGNIKDFPSVCLQKWIEELKGYDFEIIMTIGKKGGKDKRKILYEPLLEKAKKTIKWLSTNHKFHSENLKQKKLSPLQTDKIQNIIDELDDAILFAGVTHDNCLDRIFDGKKIPANSRVFSISDPDAYMVCKGQRQAIIGYRPTYTFTRNGLYCDLHLERGNPADSRVFKNMVERLKTNFPELNTLSLDDGYASAENYKYAIEELEIEKISMSGAKGRNCTPDELYNSDEYRQYRKDRSAAESYIGVGKSFFEMDRLSSRGLPSVRRELMTKMIAANFYKIHELRNKLQDERKAS
jgi:hypothetical protein